MSKIGLGMITCNRPEFAQACYTSIPQDSIDELIVVNDGSDISLGTTREYIHNPTNLGVGKSKNIALRYLQEKDCDYLFLIEDDIVIKNPEVFNTYIKYIETTYLQHFMFGYHGPANKQHGKPNPRIIVDYGDGVEVALNYHCVGAFCVYTKELLKTIGLFDETYVNAWEHVDHSLLAVKKQAVPAYWWWPDLHNSCDFLGEQACSEVSSSIRPRSDWQHNIQTGAKHFYGKHNCLPWGVPDTTEPEAMERLRRIKEHKGE